MDTSTHAAVLQGTLVLTTSRNSRGYDTSQNTYYASPTDLIDMRSALRTFCGKKVQPGDSDLVTESKKIADAHLPFIYLYWARFNGNKVHKDFNLYRHYQPCQSLP